MSVERQVFGLASRLEHAAGVLSERLADLEARLRGGDEAAWEPYLATLTTLAAVLPHVAPGARGEMLTTAQMAARLGVAPKTLLKHKAAGAVKPALQRGKLIRWKGDEAAR
jgi:hypothetical protein